MCCICSVDEGDEIVFVSMTNLTHTSAHTQKDITTVRAHLSHVEEAQAMLKQRFTVSMKSEFIQNFREFMLVSMYAKTVTIRMHTHTHTHTHTRTHYTLLC